MRCNWSCRRGEHVLYRINWRPRPEHFYEYVEMGSGWGETYDCLEFGAMGGPSASNKELAYGALLRFGDKIGVKILFERILVSREYADDLCDNENGDSGAEPDAHSDPWNSRPFPFVRSLTVPPALSHQLPQQLPMAPIPLLLPLYRRLLLRCPITCCISIASPWSVGELHPISPSALISIHRTKQR